MKDSKAQVSHVLVDLMMHFSLNAPSVRVNTFNC